MNKSTQILRNFRFFVTGITLGAFFLVGAVASFAATYTLAPWAYDPGNTGGVVSVVENNGSLYLEKTITASTNAAAGAAINNVEGLPTTHLTLSYDFDGYCAKSSPRFNIYLTNGQAIFLHCVNGSRGNGYVSFTAGNKYGGVTFPDNQTVTGIDIILDHPGEVRLSNIQINGIDVIVTPKTITN